jgi:6-pyruvoyltetrahydropterin/6-carboxytetrahydropterin synthase
MQTLGRVFEFSAAHRLFRPDWDEAKNVSVYGQCANPGGHGHNYQLHVIIRGIPDLETGMIFDAGQLRDLVTKAVIADVDHRNLNTEVPWLGGFVPTVEILVSAFFDRIAPVLPPHIALDQLVLWETPKIFASCRAN